MSPDPTKKPNLPWEPQARYVRRCRVEEQYSLWVRCNRLGAGDIRRLRDEASGFEHQPLVSILLPLCASDHAKLEWTLDSVLSQVYPHWELCACGEGSGGEHARDVLTRYGRLDERIKASSLEQGSGVAAASNAALSSATGEFVTVLDQGDELAPEALFEVVRLLQERLGADLVYSDSDEIDETGSRSSPHFKPGWSPDLLMSTNYISRLGVYRREVLDEIGGFREGFEGCEDYDLTLRFTEMSARVHHLPKVLYHSRKAAASFQDENSTRDRSLHALSEALERQGVEGSGEDGLISGTFRVRMEIKGEPGVSVIVPTRDNATLLRNCVQSIERLTTYPNYEILIVDNDSSDPETLEYLSSTPHRILQFAEEFNYSRINNFAVAYAGGEHVLLLNDDTEVISAGWMEAMLEHTQRGEVGAVGARLLYPNGLIQHAGVVLGAGNFWAPGVAAHSCQHYPADSRGHIGEVINTTREYGAVTAACMMLRKSVFEEVGGFDEEHLAVAFNDVDLCLRIREAGYKVVYTPHAGLYHYESSSRGLQRRPDENLYMRKRWGEVLDGDPYYNPNFSRGAGDFNLRADMLRPRTFHDDLEGYRKHLDEMDLEERRLYLEAERKRARDSHRTAIVARGAAEFRMPKLF